MATDERLPVHGEPAKAFKLYRVGQNNEPIELVAEADTREELAKVKRRGDWRYRTRLRAGLLSPCQPWLRVHGRIC
jgi:hypothetical protein